MSKGEQRSIRVLRGPTILVVDDEVAIRKILRKITPHWGLALDGISSDGSTPKSLQSIQFLTKTEPCGGSLF